MMAIRRAHVEQNILRDAEGVRPLRDRPEEGDADRRAFDQSRRMLRELENIRILRLGKAVQLKEALLDLEQVRRGSLRNEVVPSS